MLAAALNTLIGGGQRANPLLFHVPLTHSLFAAKGVAPTTATRAGEGTVIDSYGIMRTASVNEARFDGARRVHNLIQNSENLLAGGWTTSGAGCVINNANTITFDAGSTAYVLHTLWFAPAPPVGTQFLYRISATVWVDEGVGSFRFGNVTAGASADITITMEPRRVSVLMSMGSALFAVSNGSDLAARTIHVTKIQVEHVTGQSNQNPSEYVSRNVLSAPYHGAGVDGVKYFDTENGTTIDADGVTVIEGTGPAIARSVLGGLMCEPGVTEYLHYSDDFANAYWTKSGVNVTAAAQLSPYRTAWKKVGATAAGSGTRTLSRLNVFGYIGGVSASIVAKADECSVIYIGIPATTTTDPTVRGAFFDLTTGAVTTVGSGVTAQTRALAGGSWLCSVFHTSSFTPDFFVYLCDAVGTYTYTAAEVGDGVLLACANVCRTNTGGVSESSYVHAAGAATAARALDVVEIPPPEAVFGLATLAMSADVMFIQPGVGDFIAAYNTNPAGQFSVQGAGGTPTAAYYVFAVGVGVDSSDVVSDYMDPAFSIRGPHKLCVSLHPGGTAYFYIDGEEVPVYGRTVDAQAVMPTFASFRLRSGHFKNVRFYGKHKTTAQMAEMTA